MLFRVESMAQVVEHLPRNPQYWKKKKEWKKCYSEPGAVAQSYNHSYSGGGHKEDQGSRPAWAKT
jgi:hypothetical protein